MTDLPADVKQQIDEIASYQFFKEHNYPEAIKAITGQSSKSYYNLGTLKTLRAYNQALWSTLSWLQKARYLIADAYKDFDTAEKIKLNDTLDTYIQANKTLSQKLWTIIQVKTCYGEYSATIQALQWFSDQLDQTKSLLAQEQKEIDANRHIDTKCLENLKNINTASQTQLGLLQQQIDSYDRKYRSDLVDNIKQPIWCLKSDMTDIAPTIVDAQASMNQFADSHKNTIAGLNSQDKDVTMSLCDFAKNDSQMNEQIETSLSKLLQQLQDNLGQKQQQSQEEGSDGKNSQASSDEIQYKNVFEEDEIKLLQEIDDNNRSLIKTIQNIKWAGRYNAKSLINKLFEDFYGEPSTFENILQASDTDSKW